VIIHSYLWKPLKTLIGFSAVGLNPIRGELMTSHAKTVQLKSKVEHVTSLTHIGLDSNLLQSKTLLETSNVVIQIFF